jgi:hypothetical protein
MTTQLTSTSQLKGLGIQGEIPRASIAQWLPFCCPECSQPLALAPTITGEFDANNFSIVCPNPYCATEFGVEKIVALHPKIVAYLPDGHDPGPAKFWRGRTHNLIFGKNQGSNAEGIHRNRQMRLAVEGANPDLKDTQEGAQNYYQLKTVVGLFETKPMKSALEMTSRKIKKIERTRNMKIPEPMVDGMAKLVRKGILNAESRRPTTSRERRIIVESILVRMELWPP